MNSNSHSDNNVFILGVGSTPIGEHWDLSIRELALEAIVAARSEVPDIRPEALYVANMLSPALSGQTQLGALLADFAGLWGVEAMTVEAAGASGGVALRQAYLAIKSGQIQTALVVGIEKVTDQTGPRVDAALATSTDADYEAIQGITPTAQAALIMRRYLHEYDAPPDALAGFSINAHKNAVSNPKAMYRRAINLEQYQRAPMISEPVNMFDAASIADGGAAIILGNGNSIPPNHNLPLVQVLASSVSTAAVALHDQPDLLNLKSAEESAAQVFQRAGLSPQDMDLFELHDPFSIIAALSLEAAGFAGQGEGWTLASDGEIQLNGRIPTCTLGGSKARGDAGGATGVIQIVETALQLQHLAGENQVQGARIGMTQCLGGLIGTAATHILARIERN
ncbi:MAG: hypothetical protein GTO18_05440 [Anaerolineales bacterium]|nr:hypothetical protein [Anaerolineales bacterium]